MKSKIKEINLVDVKAKIKKYSYPFSGIISVDEETIIRALIDEINKIIKQINENKE
jgi:hypothetical protein